MEVLYANPPDKPADTPLPRFRLSFGPYLNYLNSLITSPPDARTPLVQYLIRMFSAHPELMQPFDDVRLASAQPDLLQLLELSVLPLVARDRQLAYAFGVPRSPDLFHYSAEFKRLLMDQGCQFQPANGPSGQDDALRFAYQLILGYCYGAPEFRDKPVAYTFEHEQANLTHYYRMQIDHRFVDVRCPDGLPVLQPAWFDFANGKIGSVAELPVELPVTQFDLEGFCLLVVDDVTQEKIIDDLTETLLHVHARPEALVYDHVGRALHNLLGQPDIRIGLMPFVKVNNRYIHHLEYSTRSLFHLAGESYNERKTLSDLVAYITENPQPATFADLSAMTTGVAGAGARQLLANGLRSFGIYPVRSTNGVLGVVEVGSPRVGGVTDELLAKLDPVMPLIVELLAHQINSFDESLARLIKQKFTSLQPSVEWKFIEAAWAYLQAEHTDERDDIGPVAFERVYPIYGAIDVRNSSQERYNALRQDLTGQLTLADALLQELAPPGDEGKVAALQAKNRQFGALIASGPGPEEETSVAVYLEQELNPVLREAAQRQGTDTDRLRLYLQQINPETGQFHQARQAFDDSLQRINTTLEAYLEREEKHLRTIYPYYFEKYRTDGLEFNLYIGQSLAPATLFRPDHLQSVRFWQLNAMVSMAVLAHELPLSIPLQTTQLILAHTQPLNIAFRRDEQRFDVEGAYSIRYEVIKKRIDKAVVRGTAQRLTQPDTVAIVYANGQAIEEYVDFIEALQERGRLLPGTEYLDLETLQGISGLKALRVRINYEGTTDL